MGLVFNPITGQLDVTGSGAASPYFGDPVANEAALPALGIDGELRVVKSTDHVYVWDNTSSQWIDTGFTSATFGSTPNASGYSITSNVSGNVTQTQLTLQPADATNPGGVSATTQTFGGDKTFNGVITAAAAGTALSVTNDASIGNDLTVTGVSYTDGGIDTTAAATLAIGTGNATIINLGNASATINFNGTVNNNNVTNLNVTDQLITINDGGGAGSASNTGLEIEENAVITGYAKTSGDRNSWTFKAPNTAGIATLTPGAGNDDIVLEDATQTLTNKTIDADLNTLSNIENADIKSGAAIARDKLASGSANRVVINDATGVMIDAAAITAARALISDANGIPIASSVTDTELGYLSGVSSSLQTQINQRWQPNSITVVKPLDGVIETYSTLQAAFTSIPSATNTTDARQVYTVYVPSGTYDEDVTIEINNKRIIVVCVGSVAVGTLTGTSWGSGGTPRTITVNNNGTATIGGIRSGIAFTSINPNTDGMTTHESYLSKFRISGDLVIQGAIGITSEFYFEGEVFGNVTTSGYVGNLNTYVKNSRFRGIFGNSNNLRLQLASRSQFDGLITANNYSLIDSCNILAGITLNSAAQDLDPSGIVDTTITGTFTGPAGSAKLDPYSNYWFITNGATLAGGATKVFLSALASTTDTGDVSTGSQTFAGDKTFNGNVNLKADLTIQNQGAGTEIATIRVADLAANRIYTAPEAGADASFVMTEGTQTVNGNKTLSGTVNLSALTASTPLKLDGSKNVISSDIDLTTDVTAILPVGNGGTGLDGSAAANGNLLIGNGTGYTLNPITAGTGISVTNGSGSITIDNSTVATGDISLTSFTSATDVVANANVTGLAFANATVRSFDALVSVFIDATSDLSETFRLTASQKSGPIWEMSAQSVGDNSLVTFDITSAGQVRYSKASTAGHVHTKIDFRAVVTQV